MPIEPAETQPGSPNGPAVPVRPSFRARFWQWLSRSGGEQDMSDLSGSASLTTAGAVVTAAVAITLTAWWMLRRWDQCTQKLPDGGLVCKAFVSEPQFLVWVLLIAAEATFAAVALVPVFRIDFRTGWRVWQDHKRDLIWVAVAALSLGGVAIVFAFASKILPVEVASRAKYPKTWPLPDYQLKVRVFVGLVLAVGLLAIAGIWLTGILLDRLFKPLGAMAAEEPAELRLQELKDFILLRERLSTLLTVAGVLVGLGTLVTGALRNAILALNASLPANQAFEFDQQYVLVYGLFFTGLLAIAYTPSFLALRSAGIRIREATHPLVAPSAANFADRVDARQKLDAFLGVSLSATTSFKAAVAILAPLASALVTLVLPKVT